MKKTLILLSSLLAFSCMTAQAAIYTWAPIDGSTDWSQASNWQTETGASADVPLVNPNWVTVNVSGDHTVVCGPGTTVEGWTSTINVSNGANVSLQNFTKFQRTTVSVGKGSTLTVGKTSGSIVANCDQNMNWTVYGTLNLTAALTWNANSNNLFVDLGTTGILNLTNQTDLGRFAFSASLGDLITEGTTFELVTRELVNGVGSAATSNTTITGGTQSDDIAAEELTAENVGKYQVFTENGKIYVSYINGVPEIGVESLHAPAPQELEELSEQPGDSILLDEITKMNSDLLLEEIKKMNSGLASNKEQSEITETNSGLASNKEQSEITETNSGLASNKEQSEITEITEEDLEANPQAYSSEQIEGILRNKRRIRSMLNDYLFMTSILDPSISIPQKALDTLEALRKELIANGIDPEYERYREKIKRNEDVVYSVTRYVNPTTGLFGDVPEQDVTNNKLEKILSADQIRRFNNAPQFMRDKYVFNRIVENFFPEGEMDKEYALELLKKHYQTDSMHGVVSKYAKELQRKKDEETAYNEAYTRFFDSFIEARGDYQKAIDSLGGNLNLYAENIFNQEPALKYIYQRAYNSVSWIKDEYIESGELDWDKMADRLLKLGEGETFSLAIQMLPYMLPKDNRTWFTQSLDDTVSDVSGFVSLMTSSGGNDEKAQRLALAIQQEYRSGRDMPSSWIGKSFREIVDQVPKIAAVTGSALLGCLASPATGAATGLAVGSMVYGSQVGLEAYRTNSSKAGALTYGISVGALPATVSLSLLGLAALMLRRRR